MATAARKDLPNHTAPNWGARVTEELRVLMGRAGNGQALTAADLVAAGIAKRGPAGGLEPGTSAGQVAAEKDLTPPPTPTGFFAEAAIFSIIIQHDAPMYTQGHGHFMTIVYGVIEENGKPLPTFDVAVELMRFGGPVASYTSNTATKWRLWIKWLSADGGMSAEPAGGINGLSVETGQDPSKLKELLDGQIGHEQLDPGLRGEIVDQASSVTELQAQVRGNQYEGELADLLNEWSSRARIRQISEVTAGLDGSLSAKWGVEMELDDRGNQLAGGFSLIGKAEPGQPARIDFGVLANRFYVGAPVGAGVTAVTPFTVQTTPQNINGVVVPAGVYMDAAYITNVTVLWGRFGTLVADTIQATAISAGQLTAGNGVIGGSLKSANYVAGSSGWILRPDGVAEFSGVVVRGTIYATAGTIGGITINANGLNAGAYTGYAWPAGSGTGFHLGPHGLLLGNYSTGKYLQLTEAGDFIAPGLSIVGGKATFEGQITAGGMRSKDGKFVIDLDAKFISIEV